MKYNNILEYVLVAFLVAVSLIVGIIFCELYLTMKTNQNPDNETSLVYNSTLGWDSTPSINILKNEDRPIKIYFIGDSFTHDTYWSQFTLEYLEEDGIDVDGYELGVSGHGTLQQLIKLKNNFAKYNPQVVILLFFAWNDMRDNLGNPSIYYNPKTRFRPSYFKKNDSAFIVNTSPPEILRTSEFFNRIYLDAKDRVNKILLRRFGMDTMLKFGISVQFQYADGLSWLPFYERKESQYVSNAWDATEYTLLEMQDFLSKRNSQLIILGIDNGFTVDKDIYNSSFPKASEYDINIPLLKLESIAQRNGIIYHNCQPDLLIQNKITGEKIYKGGFESHLKIDGEKVIAKQAVKILKTTIL